MPGKKKSDAALKSNDDLLTRLILQFSDPEVASLPEGKLLAAVVARAYGDLDLRIPPLPFRTTETRQQYDHKRRAHLEAMKDRDSARWFFDLGEVRIFCDWLGFPYETAMFWRRKYGSQANGGRSEQVHSGSGAQGREEAEGLPAFEGAD